MGEKVMKKPVQKGGLPEKGKHGQLVALRGVLGKNRRVGTVFEGQVDTLMHIIPISFCLWCVKISCLLYAHGYMLLCAHNGLPSRKTIVIEEVLWCVSLMLLQILDEVFHKNGSSLRIILGNPLEQIKKTKQILQKYGNGQVKFPCNQ